MCLFYFISLYLYKGDPDEFRLNNKNPASFLLYCQSGKILTEASLQMLIQWTKPTFPSAHCQSWSHCFPRSSLWPWDGSCPRLCRPQMFPWNKTHAYICLYINLIFLKYSGVLSCQQRKLTCTHLECVWLHLCSCRIVPENIPTRGVNPSRANFGNLKLRSWGRALIKKKSTRTLKSCTPIHANMNWRRVVTIKMLPMVRIATKTHWTTFCEDNEKSL